MSLERNARLLVEDYMFNRYPTWAGLQDDAFVADVVTPLQKQVDKAQKKLSADSFSHWQQTGNFAEAVETITAVCQATSLLYSGAPDKKDDLALLHHPTLNKAELVAQLRDLLYGADESPTRLERFATWATQEDLPLNWTLPTYLLFVTNPDTEFHVKPTLTRWVLKFFGKPKQSFSKMPTATSYKKIKRLATSIAAELNLDTVGLMAMLKVAYEEAEKIGRLRGEASAELEPMLKEEAANYMTKNINVPTYDEVISPLFNAMKELGGINDIEALDSKTAQKMSLTSEQLNIRHSNHFSAFEYRTAWARTYLKKYGVINNPQRGKWELTPVGKNTNSINGQEVRKLVNSQEKEKQKSSAISELDEIEIEELEKPIKLTLEDLTISLNIAQLQIKNWLSAIERKKQVVFYGPPGTGKTYTAQHLAKYIVGGSNGFTEIVQFHPAYSYEDFIIGLRPETDAQGNLTYAWKNGRFLSFCQRASQTDDPCVLIIDEINRANLARVFGELMYLLEYRGQENSLRLPNGDPFSIPKNVRIIGTMNTADRSIALVDHALRRRFAFLKLAPNFDSLRTFHANTEFDPEPLITVLQSLNSAINDPHYSLGISYFLHEDIGETLASVWQLEIEPYLEEYFFDQPDTLDKFCWAVVEDKLK